MDRLIYTVLSGLGVRDRSQAVTANNLANAQTPGFRRELVSAEGRYFVGDGLAVRAQAGAPSLATPHAAGRIEATGRPLDIALAGDAWLALQGPVLAGVPTEAYSRRGDLAVTPTGLIVNGDGRPVLGESGTPLSVPAGAEITIAADGGVSARIGDVETPLGRLKLVAGAALGNLDKAGDGLFTTRTPLPADPAARLSSGALEGANVAVAGALAELVEASRGFDVNTRLIGIAKDLDERSARLMALE